MTVYRVQDPQGQVHEFEGPANASPDQILQVAQQQFGHGQSAQSPEDTARAAGMEAGRNEHPLIAAISQAARQATFGGQNYIDAAARTAAQHLGGDENPASFRENLAFARGRSEGEVEGHPIASTVGGTAGGLGVGGAVGAVAKGSRFARAIAPVPGQKVANVAKSAATGFAVGGATGLANGENAPDALRTAAITAAAAPPVQKVATFTLSKLQPTAARAFQTLADTIGESPATLQGAYQTFQQLTGRIPSMAELVGLRSQGKLRDLAKANPTISEAAITAADLGGRPLHEQLGAINAQGATMPQSARTLTELRDTEMNTHMSTPHPQSGLTLNETPVHDQHGLLLDPRIEYALRPNTQINARIAAAANGNPAFTNSLLDRIENNQTTIGDLEVIRKALRETQSQLLKPRNGATHSRDPILAREFGDLAQRVEGLGIHTDQDYGIALNNYRAGSHYIDSFEHGLAGKSINDVSADDTMLQRSLAHVAGQRGYQHGNALNTAQQALESIAPGSVRTQDGGANAGHVAQAAMAASSGGVSAIYHALKALPVVGDRVPERVQRVIADQLFNPRTTQQGINNLRRAGVQAQQIREIGAAIGGVAGQKIADYLSKQGQ